MTNTLKLYTALLLTLIAAGARATDYTGTTFEIELIIFERLHGMERSSEGWPAAPRLRYPERWVDFNATEGDTPFLQPAATQLNDKVAALARNGDTQILFHKAWRQVLQLRRNSPAILISGGERVGDISRLGGTVTLSVARYLHLSTNLWLSNFSSDGTGIPLPTPPRETAVEEPLDLLSATEFERATPGIFPVAQPVYAHQVALLQAERRMRSGELHYIDHPAFGILIQVRTVTQEAEKDSSGEQIGTQE